MIGLAMNSRAYQFQLQAAEAAAAAPVVHAAERGGPEVAVTPKAPLLLKIQAAQGTVADELAPRQGNGLAPATTMGTIGNAAEATKYKCPECPKWFASDKAMFGHLRKHPERGYKGATRPTTATASAAAAAAAVAADKKPTKKVPRKETAGVPAINVAAAAATKAWAEADLSTKWPASVKRGRTPAVPVQQASGCSEEDEAAMILMELASSSRTSSETQQQQQSVQPERSPDAAVTGHQIQAAAVEEPMLLDNPAGHQIQNAEQQIVQAENAMELSAESQTPAVEQVTDMVITTEAVLIVVPANKPIFPSLDSAGTGNKKAKKQRRVTNPSEQTATTPPPPPPSEGAVVVRTPPARRIPSPASDKKHTCQTCGKSFPTHQALGGHTSYHVRAAKITSARHDDLAAAQAMQNILAHRDQQSAGNGNVTIPASAGAGALLQEHQEALPPPAQVKAPTPIPQASAPYVGAGAGASQERQVAQPPPAKVKAPKTKPQAAAPHVSAGALLELQEAQPPPAQAKAPTPMRRAAAPHVGADALWERQEAQTPPAQPKAPSPTRQAAAPHVGADALRERQEAQPLPEPAQAKAAAPHVCDACHLIFPSGQALGGHKRKHWLPAEKQQAKVASASAPAPAPAQAPAPAPVSAPAPRDFDLNEMPEEGQGENSQP